MKTTFKTKWITNSKILGLDTEFSTFDYFKSNLLIVSLITETGKIHVFKWRELKNREKRKFLKILENADVKKIGHNIKVDLEQFVAKYKIIVRNVFDTMLAHQLLFKGLDAKASLKHVIKKYFDIDLPKEVGKTFVNMTHNELNQISQEDWKILEEYCKNDVRYLVQLYQKQSAGAKQYDMQQLFDVEQRLVPVLVDIEVRGIRYNVELHQKNTKAREEQLKITKAELSLLFKEIVEQFPQVKEIAYLKAGKFKDFEKEFSLDSPTQISKFLSYITKGKLSSTQESTIILWLRDNPENLLVPFLKKLIEFRGFSKACTTYGASFLKYVRENRIRTSFSQCFTTTGRLSSGDITNLVINKKGEETRKKSFLFVNFQNIPSEQSYRECFIADKGFLFCTADLSGCELRILASASNDPILKKALAGDLNLHQFLASLSYGIIHGITDYVCTEKERSNHKPVIFALLYGANQNRISAQLNTSRTTAEKIFKKIKKTLKPAFDYLESFATTSKKAGVAILNNRTKRRLWLGDLIEHKKLGIDFPKTDALTRELYNISMQGTNACMMKEIIVEVFEYILENNLTSFVQLLGTVHDELKFQVREDHAYIAEEIKEIMKKTANRYLNNISMECNLKMGNCWQK